MNPSEVSSAMTAEERVRAVYPHATMTSPRAGGVWVIHDFDGAMLGWDYSDSDAWIDAASRLPASPVAAQMECKYCGRPIEPGDRQNHLPPHSWRHVDDRRTYCTPISKFMAQPIASPVAEGESQTPEKDYCTKASGAPRDRDHTEEGLNPRHPSPSPNKWDALNVKRVDAGWINFEGEQHTRYVLEEDYDRLLSELRGMERGGEASEFNRGVEAAAVVARIRREKLPVAQPRQDEAQNLRYVKQIAEYIREKYFPDVPQWKPLTGDLFGLLMQIDNMLTGLVLARSVTEGVDGWIDCKQELPAEEAVYLVAWQYSSTKDGIHIGLCEWGGFGSEDCWEDESIADLITHWQRIAAPQSSLDATKGDRG